jgi:hypothetical protein
MRRMWYGRSASVKSPDNKNPAPNRGRITYGVANWRGGSGLIDGLLQTWRDQHSPRELTSGQAFSTSALGLGRVKTQKFEARRE